MFSFGFSTQYNDREIGVIGYQRRFYSTVLGRWLNRDPIDESGGENLYAFCANNPILYYDVLGEDFWGYFMDAVKVASGLFMMKAGFGIAATAGWTGVGLAGGAALMALGADQLYYGAHNIVNRLQGRQIETGTVIQQTYRYAAQQITGKEGSVIEKSMDYAYFGAEIIATCATGYLSVSRSISAVKNTEVIHSAGHWVEGKRLVLEWEIKLVGGVSVSEACTVVATETFDVVISGMSFIDSTENENVTVRDMDRGN